jgi:hypothetical protein
MTMLFAAARESLAGTFETCWPGSDNVRLQERFGRHFLRSTFSDFAFLHRLDPSETFGQHPTLQ